MTKKEIEEAISNHADWIEHLGHQMSNLAAQVEKTDTQIEETNKSLKVLGENLDGRFIETDRYLRELGAATDKRISDLVSAIGKLINKENGAKENE